MSAGNDNPHSPGSGTNDPSLQLDAGEYNFSLALIPDEWQVFANIRVDETTEYWLVYPSVLAQLGRAGAVRLEPSVASTGSEGTGQQARSFTPWVESASPTFSTDVGASSFSGPYTYGASRESGELAVTIHLQTTDGSVEIDKITWYNPTRRNISIREAVDFRPAAGQYAGTCYLGVTQM
ncbi:MAG: hypothetical protein QM820_20140 [Minicystis sp.]